MSTDYDLPGKGSITWRINGEMVLLLGWGRAILMQIAHPLVAEGVAQHSHFYSSSTAKVGRLHQTVSTMLRMTFGTAGQALGAAKGIDTIHGRVNGHLEQATGLHYPAGFYYSARNPDLLKWVHCTFVDSMLKTYELYIGKLTQSEKDRYLKETSISGPMLGAPEGYFPVTTAELDAYLEEMLKSGRIVVGDRARELAEYVLAPLIRLPLLDRLSRWFLVLPIAGQLPPQLQRDYNLRWNKPEQFTLAAWAWLHRTLVYPLLPRRLRLWPMAIEAEKKARLITLSGPPVLKSN